MPYKNREDKRAHDRKLKAARRADPKHIDSIRKQGRQAIQRYRALHPEYAAQWERVGRDRWKRAAQSNDGSVTREALQYIFDVPVCPYCCEPLTTSNVHLDHIKPLSKGGTHSVDNLAAVCADCNMAKHSSSLVAFLLRQRVLPGKAPVRVIPAPLYS